MTADRRRTRGRVAPLVFLCLLYAIAAARETAIAAAAVAGTDSSAAIDDRIERALHTLDSPPRFTERHPLFRFVAYWFSDDVEPHREAVGVLARSGRPEVARALARALEDPDFPYRFEAGVALTQVPDPVAVPSLIARLVDRDADIAGMAARALGVVAASLAEREPIAAARDALARTLREADDPALRVAALRGLVSLGSEAALVDAFELGVADPHPLVRCGLIASMPAFLSQPPGARITRAHLRALLRRSIDLASIDEPLGVLARAVHASRHDPKVAPESEREADCIDVDEVAMHWLASMGDAQVRPALFRAAKSSDPELRATAASGLANYPDDEAFDSVVSALESPWFGVRVAAIQGLGRSKHPQADARLARVLEEGSRLDRREAARALAGSFGASLALIQAFADPAVEVREEAEAALSRSDVVVEKIEAALATASVEGDGRYSTEVLVRRKQRLEDGLARWREERREAERALAHGLAARDPRVRVRAARVLAHDRSENSLRLLLETLDAGTPLGAESAALALGLRADVRAREALERAAASPREDLAVAAFRALQDLRRPEALPRLRALASEGRSPRWRDAKHRAIALLEGVDAVSP